MEEQTFNKLAELLRPILSHNDYYAASECCTVRIEGWWVGVWMSGREQRLHYYCFAVWCPWLPLVHRLPLSAYRCLPSAPSLPPHTLSATVKNM